VSRRTVELEGVLLGYGPDVISTEISASFEFGRAYVLTGSNGSGKTSVLRVIAGLLNPVKGSVSPRVELDNWKRRPSASLVCAEDLGRYRDLKASDVIFRIMGRRRRASLSVQQLALEAAIDIVGDEALMRKSIGQLSGGQMRLVDIAIAIAGDPDVLLLDELLAGLDDERACRISRKLCEYAAGGKLVIATEHRSEIPEKVGFRAVRLFI
jgi:ABC-type multidrug transport system ATPase subunit